jgi:hypothetical protein
MPAEQPIRVNRAPVLTLWAAVVAERLGHDREAALTLGKAVAGLNAQSKGRRLGITKPASAEASAARARARAKAHATTVELLGREVPAVRTPDGLRALNRERPEDPESVTRYLESKFGEGLSAVRGAMTALARSFPPAELAASAFSLYEAFRPSVPRGQRGWGAQGELDLATIRGLVKKGTSPG